MTLMAVRDTHGVLGVVYDLAEVDEASAQLLLQMGIYDALCTEVDKAMPVLQRQLAGHFAREADGMLEQTAKRYTLAKSLGQDTAELSAVAEHLSAARDAWVTVAKLSPEQFDAYEAQGRIHRGEEGRFTSGGIRGKVLNALGIATGKPDDEMSRRTQAALEGMVGEGADSYTRMRALGQGLVASGNTNARAAGTAARLVADIGPEAQRALEPGIRRAAYRYRGTERRPAKQAQLDAIAVAASAQADLNDLPAPIQDRIVAAQVAVNAHTGAGTRQAMAGPGRSARAPEPLNPVAAAIAANPAPTSPDEDFSRDQLQLARTSDYGVLMLRKQVPDLDTATISLAAGKMPPSVGMMFDADGRLVSEAQGFNGDHYLPFDLKNLKRLKGGSYVRTRTTGGLTDEDIYTGLMTGARQVTVVSNSGVFTLEFDPDLRGGRRYSDKARQMVQRYAALTSVIGSNSLMQVDLPRERMQVLREEAMTEGRGDADLTKDLFKEKVEAARFEQSFAGLDEDSLQEQATAEAAQRYSGASRPQLQAYAAERFKALKAEALKGQAKAYKLDHDGYAAAQKALATEFPYFIREQKTSPLADYLIDRNVLGPGEDLPRRGGRDLGYTERGGLGTLKDNRGVVRSEVERTGRRPAPQRREPQPDADTTTPAAGAPAERRQQLPEGVMDYAQAQKVASERSANKLARALDVFRMTSAMPEDQRPVLLTEEGKPASPNNPEIADLDGLEYARWAHAKFPEMRDYAEFLLKPEHADHLHYAQKAMNALAKEAKSYNDERYSPAKIEAARQVLDNAGGTSFATPSGDWVLYEPSVDRPQPLLVPDLAAGGADQKALETYAVRHPQVAARAAAMADASDVEVAESIADQAAQLKSLMEWGGEGKPPADVEMDPRQAAQVARRLATHPQTEPLYRDLEELQAAWSLKHANRVVAAAQNVAPLDLGSLGKAPAPAEAPKEETAKRLVVHSRRSPAAVGLAKRASRTAVRLPASR